MTFETQQHDAAGRASAQRTQQAGRPGGANLLSGVRAVVMLAGSVRANQLRKATGRSPLEMPVGSNTTVMDHWCGQLAQLADHAGLAELPVRVMVDQSSVLERASKSHGPVRLRVEHDPSAYRGTGGLMSDLAREYPDDARLMIVHASQLPFEPLAEVLAERVDPTADVTILSDQDGTPSGVMLIRCGVLRGINPVGFVDLNEQALPNIAKEHDVRVARTQRPVTRSLRTLSGYLDTLREYHGRQNGRLAPPSPFAEDWQASFQILEGGASIRETAVIHDSVVLAGARVEAGAVVVRSVVCPGAVVGPGESRVDSVVMR